MTTSGNMTNVYLIKVQKKKKKGTIVQTYVHRDGPFHNYTHFPSDITTKSWLRLLAVSCAAVHILPSDGSSLRARRPCLELLCTNMLSETARMWLSTLTVVDTTTWAASDKTSLTQNRATFAQNGTICKISIFELLSDVSPFFVF